MKKIEDKVEGIGFLLMLLFMSGYDRTPVASIICTLIVIAVMFGLLRIIRGKRRNCTSATKGLEKSYGKY